MKKSLPNKKFFQTNRFIIRNQQGFSLLEMLVSIAILVLVMVPLMNYFFHSMELNKEAEQVQIQTNLATNIMEGLKASDIKDTVEQFTGTEEVFSIISGLVEKEDNDFDGDLDYPVMRLSKELNEATGELEFKKFPSTQEQDTYYFDLHGIEVDGYIYDALITMDTLDYKTETGTMNDYPMPKLINLDENTNSLLFSNGSMVTDNIDPMILEMFLDRGTEYAETLWLNSPGYQDYLNRVSDWENKREENIIKGLPVPDPIPASEGELDPNDYPDYCNEENIKAKTTKTMNIKIDTVNEAGKDVSYITYQLDYFVREWPAELAASATFSQPLLEKKYPIVIDNVYLFYLPSIFQTKCIPSDSLIKPDQVRIINNTANPVSLFIAKQDGGILESPFVDVHKQSAADMIQVFTNANDGINVSVYNDDATMGNLKPTIVDTKKENRIYSISIDICTYQEGEPKDKYKEILYTLQSTKEE
jgi:prepilin-type N-terminal cleavage/methylation domain-containing protein